MAQLLYKEESYQIIGNCFKVHRELGHGFLEIVYKDALEIELKRSGIPFSREEKFTVNYDGVILDHYFYADFTVFNKIILEIKGTDGINAAFLMQCKNYLKVSGYRLGILVNFGTPKLQFKRVIL